jgi:hypothetical protein
MKNILSKVLLALLAALILAEILLYLGRFYAALGSDLPIDYEGPTYYGVRLLASGGNIYDASTLNQPPFMVTIYMPLYYALCAIFQNMLDLSTGLKACRAISILSLFASGYFSYRIFALSNLGRMRSVLGLIVFFNFFALWIWSNYCRVDMLATALCLFALERFLSFDKSKQESGSIRYLFKSILLPALICIAAVFTKQSSIVVAFSILVYLLWSRKWRETFVFSLAFGAGCGLLTVILQVITGGGFLQHLKFASKMPFDWTMMMDHLCWIGLDWLKILIICASCLVLTIFGKRVKEENSNISEKSYFALSLPFLFSTAIFTLYTLGTQYPNTNHAILFYFVLVFVFLQISSQFKQRHDNKQETVYSLSLVLACLLSCALMFQLMPSMLAWPSELALSKVAHAALKKIKPNSLVFTEDPYLSLESNTKPVFVDVATFVQVWRGERKDAWENDLKEMVNNKKFAAVIVNCHDDQKEKPSYYWSEDLVNLIHQKYSLNSSLTGNRQTHNLYMQPN